MVWTHSNNVFGLRINSASANSSVNMGNALHKGHQGNTKNRAGYGQAGHGNFSPIQFNNANLVNNPTAADQSQTQI